MLEQKGPVRLGTDIGRVSRRRAQQPGSQVRVAGAAFVLGELGAEEYADEPLSTLDVRLAKLITAAQRGRERLRGADDAAEVG